MKGAKKYIILLVIIFAAVVFLSFNPAFTGSSIKENTASDEMVVEDVLPGSTVKESFSLSFDDSNILEGNIQVSGGIEDWITIEEDEFKALPGVNYDFPITISIPEGTEPGEYKTNLIIFVSSQAGSAILGDQTLKTFSFVVDVTNMPQEGFKIRSFDVYNSEIDSDNYFSFSIKNKGNKKLTETVLLEIYTDSKQKVHEEKVSIQLLPHEKKEIRQNFQKIDLATGNYFGKLIFLEENVVTDFTIYENGLLKKKGELLAAKTFMKDDNVVDVQAYFKNTGLGVLNAKMHTTFSLGGQIVQEFETQEMFIYPDENFLFEEFYTMNLDNKKYNVDIEIISENHVISEEKIVFYEPNAISLESNFYIIFALILFMLFVAHYLLSRGKRNE